MAGGGSDVKATGLGVVVPERGEVPGDIGELLVDITVVGGVGGWVCEAGLGIGLYCGAFVFKEPIGEGYSGWSGTPALMLKLYGCCVLKLEPGGP